MSARVLVVDDEQDMRTVVGLNLTLSGMEYAEAGNGEEAIAALEEGRYDACVLDLMMPKSDGFSVLEHLGKDQDELAVVVLSAEGTPAAAIRALELGAHAHLTKPFSPGAVAQIVAEMAALSPDQRAARRAASIERATDLGRLGVPTV
jgi:DNA-binding NtrC family response regulator